MKQQWMWAWFPELDRVDSTADRWSLWRQAYDAVMKRPKYWLIAAAVQVGAQIVIGIPIARFIRSQGLHPALRTWVVPVTLAVLALFLIIWLMRRQIARNIRRLLTARGQPTCIRCGYDLRRLPADSVSGATVCPECGRAWRLLAVASGEDADDA